MRDGDVSINIQIRSVSGNMRRKNERNGEGERQSFLGELINLGCPGRAGQQSVMNGKLYMTATLYGALGTALSISTLQYEYAITSQMVAIRIRIRTA